MNLNEETQTTDADDFSAALRRRRTRQPHIGSTLMVLVLFGLVMIVVLAVAVALGRALHILPPGALAPYANPRLSILVELAGYVLTAAAAYPLLRTMWRQPVAEALDLNWPAARMYATRLIGVGLVLAVAAQLVSARMSMPKEMPIDGFFHNTLDVWVMAIFGTFIAPLAEEIFFRGFLLRSVAIAFDWSGQFMGDDRKHLWQQTDGTTPAAWVVGAVISSALFAVMHAAQLGWAWNAVAVLTVVGLIFAAIRIRLNSVLASSLVHMGYNGLLFAIVFFVTDGFRHLDKIKR